ncbi:hypothetical protein PQR67_03420 [Paraburkholderia fungorum]|uniref:hypothetical protein n=1 Tax=Paraburkholderia fungorum TaxID=134537 RepID=UPI0038BD8DCB
MSTSIEPTHLPEVEIERLVPLETWLHENRRMRSIWRHGSPRLREPADMSKWLRRHEGRLTKCGAVMRLGKAWRIVEPAFRTVLFEILTEEREASASSKDRQKASK